MALPLDVSSGPGADEEHASLLEFLYAAPVGLIELAEDGSVGMANPAAVKLLLPLSADGGFDNLFLMLPRFAPTLRHHIAAQPGVGMLGGMVRLRPGVGGGTGAEPGQGAPAVVALQLFRVGRDRLMAIAWDDTRDGEREQRRLARALRRDSLTGLSNRDGLEAALAAGGRADGLAAVLLAVNIDRFSKINEAFGRAVGDEVLVEVARRLAACLHALGAAAAPDGGPDAPAPQLSRTGADEFVVLLHTRCQPADVGPLCAQLQQALAEPMSVQGQALKLSVSIGVRVAGSRAEPAAGLLHEAQLALTAARRAGPGRWLLFDPGLQAAAAYRGSLEADLRFAIDRRELFVVYQPVMALDGRGLRSVEALVRWRHPARGVVPPGEFIELAEESGLIGPLGDFVLGEACAALARWDRALGDQSPPMVAVNAARHQLADPGFAERVLATVSAHGLAPGRLQIEVTESQAAQDQRVQATLHALKRGGVSLALDDFGTGYSSLSCLDLLPVDTVKIDRSFTARLTDSDYHRALVQAILMVAGTLGLATVAEGVETAEQAELLGQMGCAKGQGYLFAKPIPEGELVDWVGASHGGAWDAGD